MDDLPPGDDIDREVQGVFAEQLVETLDRLRRVRSVAEVRRELESLASACRLVGALRLLTDVEAALARVTPGQSPSPDAIEAIAGLSRQLITFVWPRIDGKVDSFDKRPIRLAADLPPLGKPWWKLW